MLVSSFVIRLGPDAISVIPNVAEMPANAPVIRRKKDGFKSRNLYLSIHREIGFIEELKDIVAYNKLQIMRTARQSNGSSRSKFFQPFEILYSLFNLPAVQDFRLRESAEASAEELGRRVFGFSPLTLSKAP